MTLGIDHIVVAVADLDQAAARWESAGFVVTPRADHPFGTSNRLVVFEATYVELVAVTLPGLVPATGFAADVAERLARGDEGITHLALRTRDARAEAELREVDVFDFARPAPMADGTVSEAAFSLVVLDDRSRPGLFFCQHHTPGAVWSEVHLSHVNGARRITAVDLAAPRPAALGDADRISGSRFDCDRDAVQTDGEYPPFEVGTCSVSCQSGAS